MRLIPMVRNQEWYVKRFSCFSNFCISFRTRSGKVGYSGEFLLSDSVCKNGDVVPIHTIVYGILF